jgi:hypothetical protein
MSAFIVSKEHIDAICECVHKHNRAGYGIPESMDELGQELWRENYRSVNHRYSERKKTPKYKYEPRGRGTSAIEFIKLLSSLDYQSCEHPGWGKSKARRYIRELVYRACSQLSEWDEAAWAI